MIIVVMVALAIIGNEFVRVQIASSQSRPLLQEARPFVKESGTGPSILVIGDSTGLGVGAENPSLSVAGRLSADMPDARIENKSISGLKTSELLPVLEKQGGQYDILILHIGGNDIVQLTAFPRLRTELRNVLQQAKKKGREVYMLSTGDMAGTPAFGPVLSFIFSHRSHAFRLMAIEETAKTGVAYVDLFESKETDVFRKDPWKYHATDGFHPSGEGYGVWYLKLSQQMAKTPRSRG